VFNWSCYSQVASWNGGPCVSRTGSPGIGGRDFPQVLSTGPHFPHFFAKFVVTVSGAVMVTVVDSLVAFATLPVQFLNV
jgi:hypothetical protein